MFEEYAERLLNLLEESGRWLEGGVPLFLHEVLTVYTWFYAFGVFFALVGIVLGVLVARWGLRQNHSDDGAVGIFSGSLIVGGSSVLGLVNLVDLLKITLAPRLFLIEWLQEFVQ